MIQVMARNFFGVIHSKGEKNKPAGKMSVFIRLGQSVWEQTMCFDYHMCYQYECKYLSLLVAGSL